MMTLSSKETQIPIRRAGDQSARIGDPASETGAAPPVAAAPDAEQAQAATPRVDTLSDASADVDWRDTALRLKAEMANYRKRQQPWAEDEVKREKADLLRRFLEVVDNLEVALQHIDRRDPAHQGVQLAYDSLLKLLLREGVTRIFAKGEVFDPNHHEAVAMMPVARGRGSDEMRVVEVTSPGYTYDKRILRPAKVVVAKPEG